MKKILTAILCVFMCTAMVFSVGCFNVSALEIGERLEEKNYEVYYAEAETVSDFLYSGFDIEYTETSFTRGVFGVHERVNYCVYVLFCKDSDVAKKLKKDMEENMYVFADMYEISSSEIECIRQGSVVFCGHKEAVNIARK